MQRRNYFRDEGDVGGFVALAPVGMWSEEGRVRFQQNPFGGQLLYDPAPLLRVLIGDRSANAKVKANLCQSQGLLGAAAVGVHHPGL
jgi:hypothetical protein